MKTQKKIPHHTLGSLVESIRRRLVLAGAASTQTDDETWGNTHSVGEHVSDVIADVLADLMAVEAWPELLLQVPAPDLDDVDRLKDAGVSIEDLVRQYMEDEVQAADAHEFESGGAR